MISFAKPPTRWRIMRPDEGVSMTVLVTGGAGYIGSHMVHALAEAGESVVVIDNLSTGFSNFLPEGVPLFIVDAGADPLGRTGLATVGATHQLKMAVEAATGQRAKIDVFGTDYPTPDGSAIRDFIHVSDLAQAHRAALSYLRDGGGSVTLNCGYGRGYSVLETIEAVRRISMCNVAVEYAARRPGDIMTMVADTS